MYCSGCGSQTLPNATFCPSCGVATKKVDSINVEDKQSIGFNILSFIIPITGLMLFLIFIEKKPIKAKGTLMWGFIGFVTSLILLLI